MHDINTRCLKSPPLCKAAYHQVFNLYCKTDNIFRKSRFVELFWQEVADKVKLGTKIIFRVSFLNILSILHYEFNFWRHEASKNQVRLGPTHSPSKRFTCCIYKSSLVVIGLFKKKKKNTNFTFFT